MIIMIILIVLNHPNDNNHLIKKTILKTKQKKFNNHMKIILFEVIL